MATKLNNSTMKKIIRQIDEEVPSGRGGYGSVFKIREKGIFIAVKRVEKNNIDAQSHFETEKTTLSAMGPHKNIVKLLGSYEDADDEYSYLFLEYFPQTLKDISKSFQLRDFITVGIGLAKGLMHIHNAGKAHCDIKPDNLMFGQDDEVKIIDFGSATTLFEQIKSGTAAYAPKNETGATIHFDVYSYGLTMIELLNSERVPNLKAKTGSEVINRKFYQNNKPDLRIAKKFGDLLLKCISKKSEDRPAVGEILTSLSEC